MANTMLQRPSRWHRNMSARKSPKTSSMAMREKEGASVKAGQWLCAADMTQPRCPKQKLTSRYQAVGRSIDEVVHEVLLPMIVGSYAIANKLQVYLFSLKARWENEKLLL